MELFLELGQQPQACEVCHRTDGLTCCEECLVVFYCGPMHEAYHRPSHFYNCKEVKDYMLEVERTTKVLVDNPAAPANILEGGGGMLGSFPGGRAYLLTRLALVYALVDNFGSTNARPDIMRLAAANLEDILRLEPTDVMHARRLLPALYIRLGQDQRAYDLLEKWAILDRRNNSGEGSSPAEYSCDAARADALLPWSGQAVDISSAGLVMLIKLRVLFDLIQAQNTNRALGGILPPEIIDRIRSCKAGDVMKANIGLLKNVEETTGKIATLKREIEMLYMNMDAANIYFWHCMFRGIGDASMLRHKSFGDHQGPKAASSALGFNTAAWVETPGALEQVAQLRDMFKLPDDEENERLDRENAQWQSLV